MKQRTRLYERRGETLNTFDGDSANTNAYQLQASKGMQTQATVVFRSGSNDIRNSSDVLGKT